MDDCDLKKLVVSPGTLEPSFQPNINQYRLTVGMEAKKVTVYAVPNSNGASYQVKGAAGSKSITLNEGVNKITIEVAAEDGTLKHYTIEATKLTASTPLLSGLKLAEKLEFDPTFSMSVFEYTCSAPFHMTSIIVQPTVPDNKMKVTTNGSDVSTPVKLLMGNTKVEVNVTSANGTQSQIYRIIVVHTRFPWSITFAHSSDATDFECPIILKAFYQPVSIKGSDHKHIFSESSVKFLTRKTMCDPIDETPFDQDWYVPEYDLDRKMLAATIYCCFRYRGCPNAMSLSELGTHIQQCSFRPPAELDSKDVTGTSWYQTDFGLTPKLKHAMKHTVEVRSWEKNLRDQAHEENVEKLCSDAEKLIKTYRTLVSKAVQFYEHGESPMDMLHKAAVNYALAIKLKPKDAELHFHLGVVLEEHCYVKVLYGIMETVHDDGALRLSAAELSGRSEEILAICNLHGTKGQSAVEQLKALDLEFHHLKDQGQSAKSEHVQRLYDWKAQQSAAEHKNKSTQSDEQQFLDWAFLKYMDAVSLLPQNWQYNFHAGRMLLFQKKNNEALKFLQTALAQKPTEPSVRFYTGVVVLDRDDGLGPQTRYAIQYLQQGLEKLLADLQIGDENPPRHEGPSLQALNPISLLNIQLHRGIFRLGTFLFNPPAGLPEKTMTPEQVLNFSADLAAWALSKYPYCQPLVLDLEWLLVEAHFTLLDLHSKKPNVTEEFISKRCQSLALILKHTNIPMSQELLEMQQTVCQLRVEKTPCDSNALYMLGLSQIVEYDNEPVPAKAKVLIEDACLSFRASISMENKPMKGDPPLELIRQKWWHSWQLDENQRAKQQQKDEAQQEQKQDHPDTTSIIATSTTSTKGGVVKGKSPSVRGSTVPSKTSLAGRGKASEPLKPTRGRPVPRHSPAPSASERAKASNPTADTSSSHAGTGRGSTSDLGINYVSFAYRLGLARALTRIDDKSLEAQNYYSEVIKMAPAVHDAYSEFANLLLKTDPLQAVDIYSKFPVKPLDEQNYNDAFITGEIVRLLMKYEKYDDARLGPNLIAYGKVMGIASIEGYINTLDQKMKAQLLMKTYAGIHGKPLNDPELQAFFIFKHWI